MCNCKGVEGGAKRSEVGPTMRKTDGAKKSIVVLRCEFKTDGAETDDANLNPLFRGDCGNCYLFDIQWRLSVKEKQLKKLYSRSLMAT
jgi:hypothetical protein